MNHQSSELSASQQKALPAFFERFMLNINRIQKQRVLLDEICDKIDFSEYYKNQPQPVSPNDCGNSYSKTPDENDAQFLMNQLITSLEDEEYKLSKATEFISKFI